MTPPSTRPRPARRLRLRVLLLLLLLLPSAACAASQPQDAQPQTPSATAESPAAQSTPSDLDEARRRNEEAQAAYYRAQAEKLREPERPKTLWRTLSDNAALIGALTAALVALISLFFNQRTTIRAQRDTQFYEALKRFGDKDSPIIRSSAAGILAQIGQAEASRSRFDLRELFQRLRGRGKAVPGPGADAGETILGVVAEFKKEQTRRARAKPYFNTAFDQLVTGLMLEDNPVCLSSIVNATGQLARSDPAWVQLEARFQLLGANLKLQEEARLCVAEFYAAGVSITAPREVPDFAAAALLTPYDAELLRDLALADAPAFENRFKSSLRSYDLLPAEKQVERIAAAQAALRGAAARLQASVEVCNLALKVYRPDNVNQILDAYERAGLARSYERVFLPNADIGPARLSKVDLSYAQLQGANLAGADAAGASMYGAILRRAELTEADLSGASLASADLRSAKLRMTKLQNVSLDEARMEGANLNGARLEEASMVGAQLQGASLWKTVCSRADLSFASLRGAKCRDTVLDGANLTGAVLTGAELRYVNLSKAVLKKARLATASVDQSTSLSSANWWAADFFIHAEGEGIEEGSAEGEIDSGLLEKLLQRYGPAVPADPEQLHPSVQKFLSTRGRLEAADSGTV